MASADDDSAADAVVETFLNSVKDPRRREEVRLLDILHRKVTGEKPRMWGPAIVSYGSYHYRYESGREGDHFRAGFSPRSRALSIYLMGPYCRASSQAEALFARLGPHKTGQSCLYVTRLERIDMAVLEDLVRLSWQIMAEVYPFD